MSDYKPTYEIETFENSPTMVQVNRTNGGDNVRGYCEQFHGPQCKADAIRYVLARGGKFTFSEYKPESLFG